MSLDLQTDLQLDLGLVGVIRKKLSGNPLPMQYLGGKGRISNWIIDVLNGYFSEPKYILDLFGGTGSVSVAAIQRGLIPYLNDIQPYSFCILKGLFNSERNGVSELAKFINSDEFNNRLLKSGREKMKDTLHEESSHFEAVSSSVQWKKYKTFVEGTEIVTSNNEVDCLRGKNNWNLLSSYYANTYFGVKQCLQLDLIREIAEGLDDELKFQLLASTISVMTYCVSSTTHLAQYLKVSSHKTFLDLTKKRKIDVAKEVAKRLESLSNFPTTKGTKVYNLDYVDAIQKFPHTQGAVLYADPPYFKEHYSRYYHLLDTFFLYDYPDLTFNPRIKSLTTGRYRENRIVSEFGLKAKVRGAFTKLFYEASKRNMPVLLSYANTSLVDKGEIILLAEMQGFNVEVLTKKLMHSGQGQKRNKYVEEYLFVCKR